MSGILSSTWATIWLHMYGTSVLTSYPFSSRNLDFYSRVPAASFVATSPATVELLVLSLCFLLNWWQHHFRESYNVLYDLSDQDALQMRHLQTNACNFRHFLSIYLIILSNFFQSSTFGSRTLVVRWAMTGIMSGIAHSQANNPCAVTVWNSSSWSLLNLRLLT